MDSDQESSEVRGNKRHIDVFDASSFLSIRISVHYAWKHSKRTIWISFHVHAATKYENVIVDEASSSCASFEN